jgi:hypothetical protein
MHASRANIVARFWGPVSCQDFHPATTKTSPTILANKGKKDYGFNSAITFILTLTINHQCNSKYSDMTEKNDLNELLERGLPCFILIVPHG